jgi:hypothetical protein
MNPVDLPPAPVEAGVFSSKHAIRLVPWRVASMPFLERNGPYRASNHPAVTDYVRLNFDAFSTWR